MLKRGYHINIVMDPRLAGYIIPLRTKIIFYKIRGRDVAYLLNNPDKLEQILGTSNGSGAVNSYP